MLASARTQIYGDFRMNNVPSADCEWEGLRSRFLENEPCVAAAHVFSQVSKKEINDHAVQQGLLSAATAEDFVGAV